MDTADTKVDMNNDLTVEEGVRYDRQIRLWGVEAQRRMQTSHVLIAGMTQMGSELAKNLVLSGINATILDHKLTEMKHVQSQFFLSQEDVGQNRATAILPRLRALNPLATVESETLTLSQCSDTMLSKFQIICLMNASLEDQLRINRFCRQHQIQFYSAHTMGTDGIFFMDLGAHEFRKTTKDSKSATGTTESLHQLNYPDLQSALDVNWMTLESPRKRGPKIPRVYIQWRILLEFHQQHGRFPASIEDQDQVWTIYESLANQHQMPVERFSPVDIRKLSQIAEADIVPVCAIMAGILGQEIVKSLSKKDEPIQNFFYFDGQTGAGITRRIPEQSPEPVAAP